MNQRCIAIVALAMAAAAWATPPKVVDEDFKGPQFPPEGWTTEGSGSGTWSWTNPGGYARGNVSVPPFGYVKTSLKSHGFQLDVSTRLRVQFRYKTDGFTEVKCYVVIGNWREAVRYTPSHQWTPFDEYSTPFQRGVYKIEFEMSLTGGSHGMGSAWDLDDVILTRDNVGVERTSLGRVRALYR